MIDYWPHRTVDNERIVKMQTSRKEAGVTHRKLTAAPTSQLPRAEAAERRVGGAGGGVGSGCSDKGDGRDRLGVTVPNSKTMKTM